MKELHFSIRLPEEAYSVNRVSIGNRFYNLNLLLSDKDNTYSKHVSSLKKLGYQPASIKVFSSLVTSLFDNRNSRYKEEVETLRTKLKVWARKGYPFMATGFEFNPEDKRDKIIDNYRLPNQAVMSVDLVGPDVYVINLKGEENLLEKLLGTRETSKVNEAFSWMNDTERGLYLWRFNKKPEIKKIRVARFLADSDGASFSCCGDPSSSDGSLGVRFVASASR